MFTRGLVYSLQEGVLTLLRNKLVSLLSIGTIAISFTVLGIFLLVSVNVGALAESYGDALVVHVFIEEKVTAEDRSSLENFLDSDKRIANITFIDKDQAESRFVKLFPNEQDLIEDMEDQFLPESYEVRLASELATERGEIEKLVSSLENMPAVESVLFDRQWVETLEATGKWVTFAGLALGGMLILAAIVTTSNIIKMNVLSRNEEIEIMRLVGADGIFIKGPFIVGGIIQGTIASALSVGLLLFFFYIGGLYLESAQLELLRGLEYRFLPASFVCFLLLGGLVVGTLASLLSLGSASRR